MNGADAVKVFISWSGTASRAIAVHLKDWFPKVLQGIEPFVSAKDIDKGANWAQVLNQELVDTAFGVICLTPDNLSSPWLNYEAGAITKSVESRVCPVLHGVPKSDVSSPISQLQMTDLVLEDFKLLMRSMNKAAGSRLSNPSLDEAVEVWWPQLEQAVNQVPIAPSPALEKPTEPEQPEASVPEMITEVLHRMRDMDQRMRTLERSGPRTPRPPGKNLDSLAEDISTVLLEAGMESSLGAFIVFNDGITAELSEPLPEPLPGIMYTNIGALAKKAGRTIRIQGPNRIVSFDRFGNADEPPF